jgi:hypothetical protein
MAFPYPTPDQLRSKKDDALYDTIKDHIITEMTTSDPPWNVIEAYKDHDREALTRVMIRHADQLQVHYRASVRNGGGDVLGFPLFATLTIELKPRHPCL